MLEGTSIIDKESCRSVTDEEIGLDVATSQVSPLTFSFKDFNINSY